MRGYRRSRTAAVGVMRGGAQAFQSKPNAGSLIPDEITPAARALLLAFVVAAERDRSGPRDEDDAAAQGIPGVERGDGVVGHLETDLGTDQLPQDGPALLAICRAVAARARENHGDRGRTGERFRESRTDRSSRIGRREKVRAAAGAAPDDGAVAIDSERARLGSARVDPHDERSRHQGWWMAPPETARDEPVAPGRMFGCPRMRYAPRIANAIASRDVTGMPSSSLVRTVSGSTAARKALRSVGFSAPPPATMSSRHFTPAGVSRLSASATVRAVSATAVASASSRVPPLRVTR